MKSEESKKMITKGIVMLKKGHTAGAVLYFEDLYRGGEKGAACLSYLGIAIAKSKGDILRAEAYCKKAIEKADKQAEFYQNLADVYLLKRKKQKAINLLRDGLKICNDKRVLIRALDKLGARRKPIFPFLSRTNLMNRYLGAARSKIRSGNSSTAFVALSF